MILVQWRLGAVAMALVNVGHSAHFRPRIWSLAPSDYQVPVFSLSPSSALRALDWTWKAIKPALIPGQYFCKVFASFKVMGRDSSMRSKPIARQVQIPKGLRYRFGTMSIWAHPLFISVFSWQVEQVVLIIDMLFVFIFQFLSPCMEIFNSIFLMPRQSYDLY